jgi:hypothetical protein
MSDSQNTPKNQKELQPSNCSCEKDPYTDLPPELRPKNRTWKAGFREVTCPSCGLEYWTNCEGDLCMDCKKKGVQIPLKEPKK